MHVNSGCRSFYSQEFNASGICKAERRFYLSMFEPGFADVRDPTASLFPARLSFIGTVFTPRCIDAIKNWLRVSGI